MTVRTVKIVTIEGNIGSGKSTLLENLSKKYNADNRIIFLKEPVDEWEKIQDSNGLSMLQKFYENQEKYSFSFQMMAYITRLALMKRTIEENIQASIFVTERSLYTDKHVFAKMLYDANNIEDVNYQIYTRWFDTFAKDYPIESVIYVKTDPDICNKRINERSRTGEDCIPISYLTSCHAYHEKMIKEDFANIDIISIDGNQNVRENPEILEDWLKTIDTFVLQ
jgi:deoxyadenosine/deoxycytidine kinase